MKKLLLVPILLGLILFSFKDASEVRVTANLDKNLTPSKEQPFVEEHGNYKTNYSNKVELIENNESNFSIDIGSDRNTTRDTNESFVVQVKNADNIESCNYFWKISNELGDIKDIIGREVELEFPKGKSLVNVHVICGEQEANATIKVIAWEYFGKKTYHYNAYYGELEYTEREIFDYRGKCLIEDNGIYSKYNFIYDEEGRLIEQTTLYYHHPSDNEIIKFTYNSKGEKTSAKSFTLDGELRYVSLFKYNEQGETISLLSGSDMEHLEEQIYSSEESQIVYESTDLYTEDTNDQRILNDDGKVTYESYDYVFMKMIYEYSYYYNGEIEKEQRKVVTDDRQSIHISYYNDKGELLSKERSDKSKTDGTECSFRTEYTYNKQGYIATSVDILLGGECVYIDEVEKNFTYDDKGNVVNVHSVLDGDIKNGHTTMKVVKFYTNELEEF